ncbi:hypothetical protein ANCDUO_09765 [Ancylostoma duodenale]|uniref:Uncharacterized protein n=1 Tax=Ancylostoma duodenale TaxID=51022 RepID=A0A0C2GSF9_9BILA|nr:hypothetical protein ANCDUO_09765 [Ancylostoma duodenale]
MLMLGKGEYYIQGGEHNNRVFVSRSRRADRSQRLIVITTCTRQAQFRVSIDGVMTTATCNAQGADPSERCEGCCRARALAAGLNANFWRHCRWIAPDFRRTTDVNASAASSTPADEQTWEALIGLT